MGEMGRGGKEAGVSGPSEDPAGRCQGPQSQRLSSALGHRILTLEADLLFTVLSYIHCHFVCFARDFPVFLIYLNNTVLKAAFCCGMLCRPVCAAVGTATLLPSFNFLF